MIDPERRKAAEAALEKFLDLIDRRMCPTCEKPVEKYEQVGRCVYGDPCGHRQYQGKVPK